MSISPGLRELQFAMLADSGVKPPAIPE